MAEFTAFPGLRYDCLTDLSAVAAPPYDVIDEAEREHLESLDPHNCVRLILPRDHAGDDRYAVAAEHLATWERDGTLVRDADATFTVVRMTFTDSSGSARSTIGVLGALAIPGPDDTDDPAPILPHERTLPKAKSDRLALLRATRANLDPIWGLSLTEGLSALLEPAGPADLVVRDGDETHEAWIIDDPQRVDAIAAAVAASALVLADGHHRFETATRYHRERAEAGVDDPGAAAVMAYVVELAEDQLDIGPIHRLLRLPVGVDLRGALEGTFEVIALDEAADVPGDELVLIDSQGAAVLRPRDAALSATRAEWPDVVAGTDAALVESAIRPLVGDAEWEYRARADTVAGLVRSGTADAALLLRAPDVATTRAVAEARERMPQKTTFFRPKPRTGFTFRTLD